jgi:hypothetical protein
MDAVFIPPALDVGPEVFGQVSIPQHDDVGRGPLPCHRAGPILRVSGPGQAREDEFVFVGVVGKNILEGLEIGGRG